MSGAHELSSRYPATVSPDYRSEPMDSREAEGGARRAWDEAPGTAKLDRPPLNVPVVSAGAAEAETRRADAAAEQAERAR